MTTGRQRRIAIRRAFCVVLHLFAGAICFAQGTVPFEEAPPPQKPDQAVRQFKLADGLQIGLVAAEPLLAQPLSITFDDRGRMWVLQYRQFPNPKGLTPVQVDHWLRTRYDKLPEPPPKGPKGNDRISIYEDENGDGRADSVKHFLSDLNLASGMALGYGGVFVAQPPYLLFYPDQDRDDVPDRDPEVLLTGFGMDDAHAFANSLTWGPDGWLYGAQGSTATAEIRGIGFQQGVWRYHPRTKEFELFAEGGGNTWGIDFDAYGNLFAGGNTVEPLVHHVQGAYYVKGFGKHGPLHNPHTYGYFQPVKHHGYVGDSLTGGFVLYQGGAFPERFNGQCIAPNTRHSAMRWSTVETRGTTFATRAVGDFITTPDIWFRPVDSTIGPDGALYVADWYDYNISHSSPKNRSEWYQPSRRDGRVWRVAPPDLQTYSTQAFDLSERSSEELVELLSHRNAWYSRQARRLLAERRDATVLPALEELLDHEDQRLALQGLWSIAASGGFDDRIAEETLKSPHEYLRAWSVRLLGDRRDVSSRLQPLLIELAGDDASAIVRSQLACTAKRLPGDVAVPIAAQLLMHDEDAEDVHIPLLIWWAIENKAITHAADLLKLFESLGFWKRSIVERFIVNRLARRFVAEGTAQGLKDAFHLLKRAPDVSSRHRVMDGMIEAARGRQVAPLPAEQEELLIGLTSSKPLSLRTLQFALHVVRAPEPVIDAVEDDSRTVTERATLIRALGETKTESAIPTLLRVLKRNPTAAIRSACLESLAYFNDERIVSVVRRRLSSSQPTVRTRAIDLLCSRAEWAVEIVKAVERKELSDKDVSLEQVRRLLDHNDETLQQRVTKIWGKVQPQTELQKRGRITAISQFLRRARGDVGRGAELFKKMCANCHQLHGKGTKIGPDLTGAERKDTLKLIRNIVDPSAEIRPQFIAHIAETSSGRVTTGLLAESTDETITLLDAKNKRVVLRRSDVEALKESTVSLMPEKLLAQLTDQQIRDLFAYIQSDSR